MLQYETLDTSNQEIRLVHLLPGLWRDRISCKWEVVSLNDHPNYAALSYLCGSPDFTTAIQVWEQTVLVYVNLAAALRRLRNQEETVVLWVDAISIDQANLDEKSTQVALMGEIYKSAREVLVWFGGHKETYLLEFDENEVELAVLDIDQDLHKSDEATIPSSETLANKIIPDVGHWKSRGIIAGAFQLLQDLARESHWCKVQLATTADGSKTVLSTDSDASVEVLSTLANRSWWDRVWTVQEILLPVKAVFYYDFVQGSWSVFQKLEKSIIFNRIGCESCNRLRISKSLAKAVSTIMNRVREIEHIRSTLDSMNLFTIFAAFRSRKAADPRDMVFALSGGLGSNRIKVMPDIYTQTVLTHQEDIDYNKDFRTVYTRQAWLWIRSSNTLDVLMFTGEEKRDKLLPSWVPDWSAAPLPSKASIYNSRLPDLQRFYRASGEYGAFAEWSEGTCLVVHGTFIDIIGIRSNEIKQVREENSPLDYPLGGSMIDAVGRTCILDAVNDSNGTRRALVSDLIHWNIWMNEMRSSEVTDAEKNIVPPDLDRSFRISLTAGDCNELFITQERYLGQTILPSSAGDEVYVLYGCRMPMILRPDTRDRQCSLSDAHTPQRHFIVIGPCYLHGFMDGEALGEAGLTKCTLHLN